MLIILCLTLVLSVTSVVQAAPPQAASTLYLNTQSLQPGQQAVLAVVTDIPAGLHSQSSAPLDENFKPYKVMLAESPHLKIGPAQYPSGTIETYPALGKLSVYTGQVITYVPFVVSGDAPIGTMDLQVLVTYQLCNDQTCFFPQERPYDIKIEVVPHGQVQSAINEKVFKNFDPSVFATLSSTVGGDTSPASVPRVTDSADTTQTFLGFELGDKSYLLAYVGAIITGLLFNVMPCVLPVLPLKAMGFYETAQHHRARSLAFGGVFGLGVIATFGALALPIVVFKMFTWGAQFSNPWFSAAIVLILLVMGLSLFGTSSIGLPNFVYNLSPRHDTYTGNFLFGILTAVLSTPCTFALLTGLLAWAIQQPTGVGVSLLMTVGVGMALPYVVLAAFPEIARRFPRTGPWSHLFKQMMGFLLIGSALFFAPSFLHGLIPNHVHTWMMFSLVVIASIFLIVRTCNLSSRIVPRAISTGLALGMVAVALWGALLLTTSHILWQPLTRETLNASLASGRPVLVEFTADWCTNCKFLELRVFSDKKVASFLQQQNVITLRGDLSDNGAPGWEIIRNISDVGAIPLTVIYLPGADPSKPTQLAGIYSADDLKKSLTLPPAEASQSSSSGEVHTIEAPEFNVMADDLLPADFSAFNLIAYNLPTAQMPSFYGLAEDIPLEDQSGLFLLAEDVREADKPIPPSPTTLFHAIDLAVYKPR